jgi:hypothetical protein
VLLALGLFAVPAVILAEPVEPDPSAISDPIEREFEAKLRALRERQKDQTRELQARKDLTPEQRIERRRALVLSHQKEVHSLDAEYQGRLTPEARARWMERKATRQRKFDKLHRHSRDSAKAPGKSGGR